MPPKVAKKKAKDAAVVSKHDIDADIDIALAEIDIKGERKLLRAQRMAWDLNLCFRT